MIRAPRAESKRERERRDNSRAQVARETDGAQIAGRARAGFWSAVNGRGLLLMNRRSPKKASVTVAVVSQSAAPLYGTACQRVRARFSEVELGNAHRSMKG